MGSLTKGSARRYQDVDEDSDEREGGRANPFTSNREADHLNQLEEGVSMPDIQSLDQSTALR